VQKARFLQRPTRAGLSARVEKKVRASNYQG
jgi:hypothetical protein